MLSPWQDHPTGSPRSAATTHDRKDNSFQARICGLRQERL